MPPSKIRGETLRGWVRASHGYPAADQVAALRRAGVDPRAIYGASKGETTADLLSGLVAGDILVVHGSHRLGSTMAEYTDVLEALRRKRITIRDTARGTTITARELTAVSILAADRRVILGGRIDSAGVRRHLPGRMGRDAAERVWRDMTVPTDGEAARIAKWGRRTMYVEFGSSGRKQGRRPATKR